MHILNSFLKSKEKFPEYLAVKDNELELTYSQLYNIACNLAVELKAQGVKKNDTIGIYLENSTFSTYSILSALLGGQTYVPLNPEFPQIKLDQIVKDAGLSLILQRSNMPFKAHDIKTFDIDSLKNKAACPVDFTPVKSNLAYIMFTSGTTGRPKGVPITHDNVLIFLDWAKNHFNFNSKDRFSGHSRLSFDLSVFDIFCSLSVGGSYFPLSGSDLINPGPFIRKNSLSVWFSVPTVINLLRACDEFKEPMPSLRYALFCGEALSVKNARDVVYNIPNAVVENLYGPTEATIACSSYRVTKEFLDTNPIDIPIGRAFDNVELMILDHEKFEEKKENEEGTLFILGLQLSSGYFNQNNLTRKFFKTINGKLAYDTGDIALKSSRGEIHWRARRDFQVKVNGYRIELFEIDNSLSEINELNEIATCVFRRGELSTIQAHFTVKNTVDQKGLREKLNKKTKEKLSSYMIPSQYYVWEELPKNVNGKIDRKKLVTHLSQASRV